MGACAGADARCCSVRRAKAAALRALKCSGGAPGARLVEAGPARARGHIGQRGPRGCRAAEAELCGRTQVQRRRQAVAVGARLVRERIRRICRPSWRVDATRKPRRMTCRESSGRRRGGQRSARGPVALQRARAARLLRAARPRPARPGGSGTRPRCTAGQAAGRRRPRRPQSRRARPRSRRRRAAGTRPPRACPPRPGAGAPAMRARLRVPRAQGWSEADVWLRGKPVACAACQGASRVAQSRVMLPGRARLAFSRRQTTASARIRNFPAQGCMAGPCVKLGKSGVHPQ